MAVYQLGDRIPRIDAKAWIHEQATVIGAVQLGPLASVWPQATLRGDTEPLKVGAGTNIQDGSVLHADPGQPLRLGSFVTVGHQVMLHGCTVGDGSLIGIQSVVLNGAEIGSNCLVGAGSLITEGKRFPDNTLILGRPAKVVRELTDTEIARLRLNAEVYVARSQLYALELRRLA
jgi:carbonic anhydrase/acetyltransferase-like protein (isoleucine patch superfamily)